MLSTVCGMWHSTQELPALAGEMAGVRGRPRRRSTCGSRCRARCWPSPAAGSCRRRACADRGGSSCRSRRPAGSTRSATGRSRRSRNGAAARRPSRSGPIPCAVRIRASAESSRSSPRRRRSRARRRRAANGTARRPCCCVFGSRRVGRTIARSPSGRAAARDIRSTCALPGPWHRSHDVPKSVHAVAYVCVAGT